ncbi:type I-G CRISPR-associated RAMP protein Csb1/Cas7g [Iamia sp.]|uniref:type I-G CRISPR-associated RAMP protein Csb1/Cas7g n=1 Tax=Iamia sp. TaxID=2722710 RepID=UPI002C3832FF|nr:type I-U CRISPR-associated RAMP protein Csb1/Cas7u [Iamia sp.]HXH58594.1 type I-U CRISPR-associated RAMP protein Csb1/Cas7u [Iamia sp.]
MSPARRIIKVPLEPIAGSRFQPTGFPDLGAAVFDRPNPDGGTERCLLVESNQSMANRLEGTAWDLAEQAPNAVVDGLPWVKVVAENDGRYLTSSRTESHRLASAFVKSAMTADGTSMVDEIKSRLELRDDTPLAPRTIARAVFALDPFCLIHGVFFADSKWPGQPKVTRALTASIEAHGIHDAVSGGVKRDQVRHSINDRSDGGTKEGYGSVPFSRSEYTAKEIIATFVLDLALLDSFGLPAAGRDLLESVALWEVRTLLDGGLRLRTACDLTVIEGADVDLPEADTLTARIREGIEASGELIGPGVPLTVRWSSGRSKP